MKGKQFILHAREGKGDLKVVEQAARDLERERVDLIYPVATSAPLAVKRATKTVPIVFNVGGDPVAFGLVESFRKPGGRLTGIHNHGTELTAKRLELLKGMVPRLRRVVTFYNPGNRVAGSALPHFRHGRVGRPQIGDGDVGYARPRKKCTVNEMSATSKRM